MTAKDIMDKYSISDEELLQIQAMHNGTTMVSDSKDIEQLPAAERGPVSHVESFGERDRAMGLYLKLTNEELAVLVEKHTDP